MNEIDVTYLEEVPPHIRKTMTIVLSNMALEAEKLSLDLTGIIRRMSCTIVRDEMSLMRAAGPTMMRWARVTSARSFTSSGVTYSRPRIAAIACDVRNKASEPRGLLPKYTSGWDLDARTRLIMYCFTASST